MLKVAAESGEPGDLSIDLFDVAAQEVFGGLAGTCAGVADGQQFGDLLQAHAEPLGALDELQPVQGARGRSGGARRWCGPAAGAARSARSSGSCRA